MEHVIRRAGRYVYRRRVPVDLIAVVGRKEITQALGTSDPREAAKAARRVAVEIDEIFDRARSSEALPDTPPQDTQTPITNSATVQREHEDWLRHRDQHEEQQRTDTYESEEEQTAFWTRVEAKERRQEEREAWFRRELSAAVARVMGRSTPPAIQQAASAVSQPATGQDATKPARASKHTLQDALALWSGKRKPVANSLAMATRIVGRFEEQHGKLALSNLNRQHFTAFQAAQTGSTRSTRVYLSLLKAILAVAVDEGWISSNVAAGIKTEQTRSAKVLRLPFEPHELKAVLDHAATFPKDSARHWLPLLGAYTGARLEELGQLLTSDIREEKYRSEDGKTHKVSVIYITDEGEDQKIKNASSQRKVPVHPILLAAGFVDFVNSRKTVRLFADLKKDRHGRFTSNFSGWFGTQLRKKLEITDEKKTFHSTRHNFKDALRESGILEQVGDALMGHTTGTVSRSYGGAYYPLRPLVEAVAKITYHL